MSISYRHDEFEKLRSDVNVLYARSEGMWTGLVHMWITIIKIACPGNGLGGQSWYEYVVRGSSHEIDFGDVRMIEFRRWDGTTFTVNPEYIITSEDYTLVIASYMCKEREYSIRVIVEKGKEIELSEYEAPSDMCDYNLHVHIGGYDI